MWAAHGYFGRLILVRPFQINSRSCTSLLALRLWQWFTALA